MNIDETDLRALFDIAVASMDFGSGFLDHDEVMILRKVATALGVDPAEGTPHNFRASFAHDFTDPRRGWDYDWSIAEPYARSRSGRTVEVCGNCEKAADHPCHHGVSITDSSDGYRRGPRA